MKDWRVKVRIRDKKKWDYHPEISSVLYTLFIPIRAALQHDQMIRAEDLIRREKK